MRFRDLPQFTRTPCYHVNCSWDFFFKEWTQPRHGFPAPNLNPDFQRGHVWTKAQQIAYIEFKLKGGTGSNAILFNHPGWMRSFEGDFVLVDGLQRVTAVQRFLENKIKVFGQYYRKDFEDRIPSGEIDFIVHVNNLQTRAEVLQWYLELNAGGTPHKRKEIDKVRLLLEKEKQC